MAGKRRIELDYNRLRAIEAAALGVIDDRHKMWLDEADRVELERRIDALADALKGTGS